MKSICLILMKSLSTLPAHIPANVDAIVKSRITNQFKAQYESSDLYFDNVPEGKNCSYEGTYSYTIDSLVIVANASTDLIWEKPLTLGLTGILDGLKIDFPMQLEKTNLNKLASVTTAPSASWAYAVGSAAVLTILGVLAYNSKKPGSVPTYSSTLTETRSTVGPQKVKSF